MGTLSVSTIGKAGDDRSMITGTLLNTPFCIRLKLYFPALRARYCAKIELSKYGYRSRIKRISTFQLLLPCSQHWEVLVSGRVLTNCVMADPNWATLASFNEVLGKGAK